MNRKLIFAVAAASALLLSSCRKADEVTPSESQFDELEFTATIDGPVTKTTVNTNKDSQDRGKIEWEKGDSILIKDAKGNAVYYVTEEGDGKFRKKAGQTGRLAYDSKYSATYGTKPSTSQKYADYYGGVNQAKNVYMEAPESENRSLTFKAAYGLLKLTLTSKDKADESITKIDVTGTLKDETKSTTYTLNCVDGEGNGVSIKNGNDFYLSLPAGTYTKMVFCNAEGSEYEVTGSSGIENNKIQPVTIKDVTFTKFYPGTEWEGIKIGDVTWAPVNCGYEPANGDDKGYPYGLLYQWGRKYGQAYDAGTITPKSLSMSDGQLESNSGMFGKYNTDNWNWFSGIDNTLWNGSTKGTYDPCPPGWRVPTSGELDALKTNKSSWTTHTVGGVEQTGYWFNGSSAASEGTGVFLPADGYRARYDGIACARAGSGYYWSSSVNGNEAWSLYFYTGYAEMNSRHRAFGYSVRCVKK